MEYTQKERAKEDSPYMNRKREYQRKLYAEKIKTPPEKWSVYANITDSTTGIKTLRLKNLSAKDNMLGTTQKKKREQRTALNTGASASSSYEDSEEMNPAGETPKL